VQRSYGYEIGEMKNAQEIVNGSDDRRSAECSLLARSLSVGNVTIPNRVFLAPMSGVSDLVFRKLAEDAGAGMVVSEMVASAEFCKGKAESELRSSGRTLRNHVVQLAGREAYWMGEAAKRAEAQGAAIIDINMGCPAKKVTGGYSGSALMRDLDHALTLIDATAQAVKVPVTLKMRLGWDGDTINAPELAARAEAAGVRMITVHGRTRCQFYEGRADWSAVRAVKQAISVPLVVNGDIRSLRDAMAAIELSGADAVMIGRASYGRPWLAGSIAAQAAGESISGLEGPEDLGSYVIAHYQAMISHYGLATGVRHARKHLGWYFDVYAKSAPAEIRRQVMTSIDPDTVVKLLQGFLAGSQSSTRMAA
jgi:nifR3 family TIM-barrel protein